MSAEIRGAVQLPARREEVSLRTSDGLTLVGELAEPLERRPVATLVTLHPLPTQGGFMDSHILRKAAARLPALADIAVLRFNTRGTVSPRGRSEGTFGDGEAEAADLAAAVSFVAERGLPVPWLVGWSFGTEVALKHGRGHDIAGLILLSPPLRRTTERELAAWAGDGRPMVAVVPEWDDFLPPVQARERFAAVPHARIVDVPEGKHLWVGETQTRRVLDEIVSIVRPGADPLPTEWSGELG
ncbi:MAG: alpha/beta fold hydrolase [Microbacterium ginsengisoli]|uniref:alpha/beta hydrolase n=1 Tax=Microbacterium TaxID=33882 RepID=UPI0007022791|nr:MULTISPECIES: alpha/beta fold hydrolase [unclassified Microbacterium]KQR92965.1 alpha/beta hydrolase [Microbacterium sp. Leaf351]KQS05662.1 alpha/beta hydrolase [Microbacterium sp. Leaf347]MBN9197240.1 alpha/beta fold hydrolase [Microbacterium ginsengisoli]OJU77174.1 MAG: alpha/beta hydrolase [Microbacterium sp. 71-23]